MGRYSQARRRGRGQDCGSHFTVEPPILDTEWAVETGGGSVFGDLISAPPAGADGIEFEDWIDPDGVHNIVPWFANPQQLIAEQPDGEVVNVKARWTLLGVAVSDWSVTTQITVIG
jgi:hypothetical protein